MSLIRLFLKPLSILFVFLFILPFEAFANGAPLKAAVPLEKPWSYYNDKGELEGLFVSYFKALSIELGRPILISAVPLRRVLLGMEKGNYDLSLMFREQASKGTVTLVAPTLPLDTLLIGLRGLKIKNNSSIEGLRLAMVRGASSGSWIDENDKIKKISTSNYNQAVWLLKQGRVDAISGSYPVLENVMKKQEMDWTDLNKPYLLSCRFVMLVFSNFSSQYSELDTVRRVAKRLQQSPKWNVLLNDVSEFAPSMLGAHVHHEFLKH
ncbi:substrate-binding periplasmic protein [Kiloniella antarctica]|uniref:Substrate-binding periplasmic protein n=1 Tax=Kiloniella antarctica TaxID=1550907 RepID=A0ABW5BJU7_9PROT